MSKRAVLVVGMPPSGTSVLSRGLHSLGIFLGDSFSPCNEWNPERYFEHTDIAGLNDTLLALVGKRWHSLALPPWAEMEPLFEPYKAQAVALLEKDFAGQALCAVIDPRSSRLMPFWQSVFETAGVRDSYVIALRTPGSVARSLSARNGFRPEKSCLLWLQHLVAAMRDTQGKARVVVDHDALMAQPAAQLRRIAATLELRVTAETRQATAEYEECVLAESLEHSPEDPSTLWRDPRIGELVARTYELLRRLAHDGVNTPKEQAAFVGEWRSIEDILQAIAPVFHYLDACEDRIDVLTLQPATTISQPVELPAAERPLPAPVAPLALGSVPTVASDVRVSVVIPLYNHEKYIEAAIGSVLSQTVRAAEIIVVDDGSSDGSAQRMQLLCNEHPEIIFWSWPNQGAHQALNAAILRATGDFVAILNSDDCYDPERLAACLAVVESDPSVDVVATGVSFVDGGGRQVRNPWYEDAVAFYRQEGDLSLALFHANFLVTTSNLFIRRSLFERVGHFSPLRYTHDLEFCLRLIAAKANLHFLDRPLLTYRMHDANTISENRARTEVEQAAVFAFFLYRHCLAEGCNSPWRSWPERYVEVLGRGGLLDLVEYFVELLEGKQRAGDAAVTSPLASEFRGFLSRLGVDLASSEMRDSLLAQLVSGHAAGLRRWERSDGVFLAAFSVQEQTITAMREDFDRQERNIEDLRTRLQNAECIAAEKDTEIRRLRGVLSEKDRAVQTQVDEIRRHQQALAARERELAEVRQGSWHKLGEALRQKGMSLERVAKISYYSASCFTPQSWKPALQPFSLRVRRLYEGRANPVSHGAPRVVRRHGAPSRRRVLHVIANFMLGGSSRLVVDLVEGLGDAYEHKVVTSYLPSPPAYTGVDVVEFRSPQSPDDVLPILAEYDPSIVHVHYWGDVDWWWYDIFFRAIQTLGCHVIENVNTPVEPYRAYFVDRYVHVSRYVEQRFGDGSSRNMTIYPGIDFGLFSKATGQRLASDCIGMVYRLETDKLNEQSIEPFIKVVQRRPRTRAFIVGGGTYLEPYQQAVRAAGVAQNFEFTGYVDYRTLPDLYRRMSLFVAPVWKESFGQVGPFAMNLGIPVVGYSVGGLVEIVDDESLLAPLGDSDALADLIIELLDDPARCQQIGDRNCARAQRLFSVEAMTGAYRALYAELVEAEE